MCGLMRIAYICVLKKNCDICISDRIPTTSGYDKIKSKPPSNDICFYISDKF